MPNDIVMYTLPPSTNTSLRGIILLLTTLFLAIAATAQQPDLLAWHPTQQQAVPASQPVLVLPTLLPEDSPNVRFFPKHIQHEGWMRFDNPESEPHYLELLNPEGDCVWQGRDGGSGSIQLKVAHLPAGSYDWTLTSIGGTSYEGELTLR